MDSSSRTTEGGETGIDEKDGRWIALRDNIASRIHKRT